MLLGIIYKMKPIQTALFILAVITKGFAQGYQLPDPLSLHYGSHKVVIPQLDKNGPHDYNDESCLEYIDRAVVHAVIRRKNNIYVVYSCAGFSRGPEARGGNCGSGWERQMNWVVISDGRVAAFQQMDIESCWRNRGGSIDGWKRGNLIWRSDGIEAGYTGFFDPKCPEMGLQTMETHDLPTDEAKQASAGQQTTRPLSKPESKENPKPESEIVPR